MSAPSAVDPDAIRVVIADDEALVRQGLRLVLERDAGIAVVGEAGDGEDAVTQARGYRPDVILLDIRMPRLDGIGAACRIAADPALTHTAVLMLTTFAEDHLIVDAVRGGASGYLLKSMSPEDIRAAVRSAAAGQTAVAPTLVARLLQEFADHHAVRSDLLDLLTDRETDVLREVASGRSNREIAARLNLGEGTVKSHVAAILRKLQVRDRTQAAVAAYEFGLLRPHDR